MPTPAITGRPLTPAIPERLIILVLVFVAVIIGVVIAESRWLLLLPLAAIPLLLLWPVEVALGVFAVLVPFDSAALSHGDSGKTIVWFVGAGAAATLVATGLVRNRLQRPPRAAFWWILFIGWCAVTVLWAQRPELAVNGLPTAFASLAFYLASVCLRIEEKEFRWITHFAVCGGAVAACYASYEFYHGIGFVAKGIRGSLVFGAVELNPNFFATRLLLPMALAVAGFLVFHSGWKKMIMLGAACSICLAILLSMSRAAALAVVIMGLVFLLRLGMTRRVLFLFVAFGTAVLAAPSMFFSRFAEAASSGGAGRVDIWKVGLQLLKHYGVFGAGLDNFQFVYPRFSGYAPRFMGYVRDPHNIYLAIGVEMGVLGILLFLNAVRVQLLTDRSTNVRKPNVWVVACEAATWAMIVAGVFENLLWEKAFWLTLVMLALAAQVQNTPISLNACDQPETAR
jgi:O-antigen ligase